MSNYRVEIASTGRAGCQNLECKKNGIKILKGQLRLGVYVTIQDYQSWKWKHWGCVTPKQVSHIKTTVEDDITELDGYDEIPEEDQARLRRALADGHIPDEDWTGDLEMNREGKNGYRIPASKKKAKEQKAEDGAEESASPSKPASKKRGRAKQAPGADDADVQEPVAKKAKTASKKSKKVKMEDGDEKVEDNAPPQKKGRKRASKKVEADENVAIKNESSGHEEASPPAKKVRAQRKATPKKIKAEDTDTEEENDVIDQSRHSTPEEKVEGEDDDVEPSDKNVKPRKARKKSSKQAVKSKDTVGSTKKASKAKSATTANAERFKRTNGRATRANPG